MAFHFSLESVLRLRASLEDVEKQRLAAIHRELAEISERVQSAREALKVEREKGANELNAGIRSSELNFQLLCREQLRHLQQRLQADQEKVRERRRQQKEQYLAVRKQRETVERLKEKAQKQYELETKRKDQSAADEMFLMRRRVRTDD
jgi:flagellar export protein FliJ